MGWLPVAVGLAAIAAMAGGSAFGAPVATGVAGLLAGAALLLALGRRYPVIAWPLGAAFALRAGAALFGALVAPLHDSGADAMNFELQAAHLAEGGISTVLDGFVMGAGLYPFLVSIPYLLLGRSPLLAASINVLLGALVVFNVFLLARELWGERAGRRAAWAAALWPGLVLYSAITLREAAFVYPLTLGAFLLVRWIRDPRARWLALSSFAIGLAAWFHRGASLALAVLMLAALAGLVRELAQSRVHAAGRRLAGAALALGVSVLMMAPLVGLEVADLLPGTPAAPPSPELETTPEPEAETESKPPPVLTAQDASPQMLEARQNASAGARSAYLQWLPQRTVFDVVWQAPLRSAYFLFSPMPWDVSALKDVVGLLDGLLYFAMAVLIWRGRRKLGGNDAAIAILAMVLLLVVVYAANTHNAGTALRHRAKFAPLLIALVPIVAWPALRHSGTRTRVLHVVNGPESFLQNRLPLALAARKAGYQVEAAGPMGPGVERIRGLGFNYHIVPLDRRGTNPLAEARTFLALLMVYRRSRPDIVHHFTIKPVVYGGIAARLGRVPICVHTITGLGYVYTSRDAKARAIRPLVSLAYTFSFDHPRCRVVFQNEDDRALLESSGVVLRGSTAVVRGSGVDLDAYRPQPEPEGTPVVVLPSRMLRDKGVAEFVEAARSLRATGARFVLVGDTDDRNPAAIPREDIEAWAKEGAVEWWGWREDMPHVYAQAHVVCLPSYREGLPKSLLEAAACGRPLVATDVPGCREVVVPGVTGLLVPPRDAGALADALRALVEDPERRLALGAAARRHVEAGLGTEAVAEAYLGVYAEALAPRPEPEAWFAKRALDVTVAATLLVLLSPVLGAVALAVRLRMGSPVLYRAERAGRGGRPFTLFKFRTMTEASDAEGRPLPDEARLTPLGAFLRRTTLDELPELVNVLRGDMSLVGPRPLHVRYNSRYSPRQARRLDVLPGLTGWAVVNGRNALSWSERLELDAWYVENRSFRLDVRILLRTVALVASRKGVSAEGHATMPEFEGAAR